MLRPYVDLLLKKGDNPENDAEIFAATQLMVRPGLAQTQAVLARELTGGTDEASRLFRQAVTLTRQVERSRIELARLNDLAKPTPEDTVRMRDLRASLSQAQKEQLATQSALGSFPSVPGGVERGHLACRPAENPAAGRGLLPHDHRR